MAPRAVAAALSDAGIQIAAVTDHNSSLNSQAFAVAFDEVGITPLYGMELETSEEVHLLCLFRDLPAAQAWQEVVLREMPWLPALGGEFGEQIRFDIQGAPAGRVDRLLSMATRLTLEGAVKGVWAGGGIPVPAHINRPAYGLLGVLGLVPPGLDVPAMEISPRASERELRRRHDLAGYRVVSFSDAHCLDQIQPARTVFSLAEPTFDEVALALRGDQGRRVLVFE